MPGSKELILGEFRRKLDDRYRLTIPGELAVVLAADAKGCILAKEYPGCLSLWNASKWKRKLDEGVELVQRKIQAGKLEGRLAQVQLLGRLLSTRHKIVQPAGRGRLLIPEGFREFIQVEPGAEVMVVGAAVCVEIWNPETWLSHLEERMPKFRRLFDQLSS